MSGIILLERTFCRKDMRMIALEENYNLPTLRRETRWGEMLGFDVTRLTRFPQGG